jgi:glutamine---fructose-6-phosphate transaminase (isomerizing)
VSGAFQVDVGAQAQSLRDFDRAPVCLGLYPLLRVRHERIVLTGMGASHFAALPGWRRLVARGRPTWWIDAGRLLDNPELVTADSLLVATSRSGECGEVVALVEKVREMKPQAAIVAVTDNAASPLVGGADGEILLRSASSGGPKGFLNALAAHDYLAALILDEDSDDIDSTVRVVAAMTVPAFGDVVAAIAANPRSRLAFIGFQEHAATALYAGLLATEATGVTAEAYIGGQFRHGPARAANANLTAVVFSGRDATANAAARRLAADLVAAGSTVMVVGDVAIAGVIAVPSPDAHVSAQVAHGVVIVEQFVSALARAQPLPARAS